MRLKILGSALLLLAGTPVLSGPIFDAAKAGDTDTLIRLLTDGWDANEPNVITPLQIAAFNGELDTVKILIERGADLDAQSTILGTALHGAAQRGYAETIEILVKAGADPNARNKDEFTPLMIAALHGHGPAVRTLIDGGADVDAVGYGRTNGTGGYGRVNALHLAKMNGHEAVVAELQEGGAAPKPPLDAGDLVAASDPGIGRELASQKCGQCHKILSDTEVILNTDEGLSLVGVFGRQIASRDNFEYSQALLQTQGVWTEDLLYSFAVDAMLTIPGTSMRWHDGWTDEEVAHIVAYFKSVAE